MPINFRVNDDIRIFTTIGDVEYHEGLNVLKEGLQGIKTSDPVLILFDIRLSRENRTHDEIHNIAQFVKPFISGKAKISLLVDHDLYYGLSRMFMSYVEEDAIEAQIFKDYDDAIAWLKKSINSNQLD